MLCCFPAAAAAQSVPPALGSDLLRSCNALIKYAAKGGDITPDATSCAAYLKGLRDGAEAAQRTAAERPFCASAESLDQMARVIVKHVQARPENARRHAVSEALAALADAYPCKPRQ